jgi:hypothetical protein
MTDTDYDQLLTEQGKNWRGGLGMDTPWSPMKTIPRDGTPVLVLARDRKTIGLGSIQDNAWEAEPGMPAGSRDQVAWFGQRRGDTFRSIWLGGDKITEAVGWKHVNPPSGG